MATATISTRSIQGESLSAANDRLVNTALLKEGVIDFAADSYKVAQDTGANMKVKTGSGTAFDRAVVEGDNAGQGTFICEHANATQTLAVAAAHATNPRIDIVVLRIYDDTFDSSGLDEAELEVIQGTPAVSPSAPATPNSALKLAEIEVAAAVTAVTDANITDTRSEATFPDRLGYEWKVWSPTLTGVTVGNGTLRAVYAEVGKLVFVSFRFSLGSTSSIDGSVAASVPITPKAAGQGIWEATLSNAGSFTSGVAWPVNLTDILVRYRLVDGTQIRASNLSPTVPFTWATGDYIAFDGWYEAA